MDATITVFGSARRRVVPDIGTWTAAVEARGADERSAYVACAAAVTAVLTAVQAAASDAEVSAGGISVGQEWDDTGRRRVGALGSGTVAFRGAFNEIERLAQAALEAGALRLDGPVYEVSTHDAILVELGAQAIGAARDRAQRMAAAAGRPLGPVLRVVDGIADAPDLTYGVERLNSKAAMDAGPVSPAVQELRSDVTVTFSLA